MCGKGVARRNLSGCGRWRWHILALPYSRQAAQYQSVKHEGAEAPMLSETERESVQKTIDCLNRVLDSLLAQYRSGLTDIDESIVRVTEALENLEEMLSPVESGALQEWRAAKNRTMVKPPR
jgi:hypothetical protein